MSLYQRLTKAFKRPWWHLQSDQLIVWLKGLIFCGNFVCRPYAFRGNHSKWCPTIYSNLILKAVCYLRDVVILKAVCYWRWRYLFASTTTWEAESLSDHLLKAVHWRAGDKNIANRNRRPFTNRKSRDILIAGTIEAGVKSLYMCNFFYFAFVYFSQKSYPSQILSRN